MDKKSILENILNNKDIVLFDDGKKRVTFDLNTVDKVNEKPLKARGNFAKLNIVNREQLNMLKYSQ